jgi:hypothetical protein
MLGVVLGAGADRPEAGRQEGRVDRDLRRLLGMRVTFTPHARRRMEERGISQEEAIATLEEPDRDYRGRLARRIAERTPPGRRLATKVVYNFGAEGERIVVTVERGRPTEVPPRPEGGEAR